jgi:hypothetical protein
MHINIKSLPVIYKNTSNVWMACSISKILKEMAWLLLEHFIAHPSTYILKLKDED